MAWLALYVNDKGRAYAHTIPLEDLVTHDETPDCVCRPTLKQLLGSGHDYAWAVVHHSLDGRELVE